ncbi:MAG: glycoside hydrolase family 32 protein [Candidatus Choladocola sp.]|nr:glycoside hydrolase family 32 protein [Candidatus Choladocola sp.]
MNRDSKDAFETRGLQEEKNAGFVPRKYHKVLRKDYEQWYEQNEAYREAVKKDPDRLVYHLMPDTGWLNDPNGLCQLNGEYHIYYQYTPFEPTGELKLWGHYVTKDFVHYTDCAPVLFPDHDFDAHGVYSGSAFVEDGTVHYFYTGNVKYFDRDDYDYIMAGRGSNTVHCTSRDGFHFTEKELILTNSDYPDDMSAHIRDPKILKKDGYYYMVLGARDKDSRGMVLVYRSADLKNWTYFSRITTEEPFGYMWECPDLFWLEGQMYLICCPQGVTSRGLDFQNVHQCTVMKTAYDFEKNTYIIDQTEDIRMVDRGFDFYAPQTFEDEQGRRIMIGWMGIPDAEYTNPTVKNGWQHALTIPRVLHTRDGRLIQEPVEELQQLRRNPRVYSDLTKMQGEKGIVYEAEIDFSSCETVKAELRRGVFLEYSDGILSLDPGNCGSGRTIRQVKLESLRRLRIFSDTSSLEIFVNDGEETFTSRVYGQEGKIRINGKCSGTARLYDLAGFHITKG